MAKKVILVDDSSTVIMSAEMILEEMVNSGVIEFEAYDNPLEAIADIKNGKTYDLLITDINMPQMNGFDVAKALKSIPSVKMKPIIALTTENSPQMKVKGKQVGLVGWMTKPFSEDKLKMGIKRVLRIR
jgi:two-component system chemotaxis response regulator CheY